MESDNFRIKLKDWFNFRWRGKPKFEYKLNYTSQIDDLIKLYERIYSTKMSRSQIVNFLIHKEIEEKAFEPTYEGDFSKSNIARLKDTYILTKVLK